MYSYFVILSMVGKSTLLCEILHEKEYQFEYDIEQLVYIYTIEDDNIRKLKKKFSKNGLFLKEIPENLPELLIPKKSVLCIDDKEEEIVGNKRTTKLVNTLCKVWVHHCSLICFLLFQSFDMFYKRNPLNPILQQSTRLILFKSVSNFASLKRWLNGYSIKLKANQTLFDCFNDLTTGDKYAYLILDLSPNLNSPHVYSNILYADPRPLLVFHVEPE